MMSCFSPMRRTVEREQHHRQASSQGEMKGDPAALAGNSFNSLKVNDFGVVFATADDRHKYLILDKLTGAYLQLIGTRFQVINVACAGRCCNAKASTPAVSQLHDGAGKRRATRLIADSHSDCSCAPAWFGAWNPMALFAYLGQRRRSQICSGELRQDVGVFSNEASAIDVCMPALLVEAIKRNNYFVLPRFQSNKIHGSIR